MSSEENKCHGIDSEIAVPRGREKMKADYAEALKLGEAPVAYARVMFLGPGGSGKSSVMDGLMNQPLRLAESTALADILDIKYHWVEAADTTENAWTAMTEEDEVQELASLFDLAMKDVTKRPQGVEDSVNAAISTASTPLSDQDAQKAPQIVMEIMEKNVQNSWEVQQQQMQLQLQQLSESTALADILDVNYHWVEAADTAENAWTAMTDKDEVQEMAPLFDLAMKGVTKRPQGAEDSVNAVVSTASTPLSDQGAQKAARIQMEVMEKIVQKSWEVQQQQKQLQVFESLGIKFIQVEQQQPPLKLAPPSTGPEVMMRIWDCGGQPVFLDILSAFLTSRTMFLLLFDASLPLNSKCQESWMHKGHTYHGKEYHISFLQLIMQWMRLIHTSLVAKNEVGIVTMKTTHGEATKIEATQTEGMQSEATTDRGQPASLPQYPRIMVVGTHGDKLSPVKAQQVLQEIESSCNERAFQDLVVDKLIIDNTTAGRGRNEDPSYRRIRKRIYEFTHSLTAPTPLAWVSFRKVVQKAAVDSPVMSYEQITTIAETCGIARSKVPSVLHFYHQLGVFLHYKSIKLLSTTIIAEPQWLIKQLCKLLMPEWYYPRPQNLVTLWQWLEGKGVLVEPLYQDLWGNCGLEGGAQALIDLLEHFDLAKEIDNNSLPKEMRRYKGCKYFMPCMLKARLQEGPDGETTEQPQDFIQKAATLYITFNTRYSPPGFFVRLAAQMMGSKMCTPIFERNIYRDSITFHYGQADRVTITESKSFESVHVDIIRDVKRTPSISRFADSCVSFQSSLDTMCKEVLHWFPSIEVDFAFKCSCSDAGEHFAVINNTMNRDSKIHCCQDREYQVNPEHKYWFPPAQHTLQPDIEDGKLSNAEIHNVAKEIKTRGRTNALAREMEVEYGSEEESPEYGMISDWVMYEKGTRYKLAEHLREAGLTRLSTMLLRGDMQSSSDSSQQPPQMTSNLPFQKHGQPSLPLLLEFPSTAGDVNIMERIGTHYEMLGTLLLNDDTGALTDAIVEECRGSVVKINRKILQKWIQGKGRKPVSWDTLVKVLKKIELSELASTIENSLP